ncbi:hypothetical protein IT409_01795 [Candidatus Falkowbacteria bacterium]|nr:hypothetical protein [Candidatus Falkowbacteria bacterium]
MFNIIPFIIIIASLFVILIIILRKFPQLARIDTTSSISALASRTKNKILGERLLRKTDKLTSWFKEMSGKMSEAMKEKVEEVNVALEEKKEEIEREQLKEMLVTQEDEEKKEEIIEEQLEQAQELSDDNFEKAEQKYIDILTADPKNVDAYMGLGSLYVDNGKFAEASQTFSYAAKLAPQSAEPEFALADLFEKQAQHDQALAHAQKAVSLEQNPRFITQLIEIAIVAGNKQVAADAIALLEEVNPENGAIEEYKEQVSS